jgi:APA family basic amino acid/polyamine antiporter
VFRSLFALKPLHLCTPEASDAGFKRSLGALDLTLLGVGCIMGTGIFVLTGQAAATNAGPAVTLSFALAALVAAFGALCYAELAAMLPVVGSAYTYAYASLGELAAFYMGWNLGLEWLVGAAAVAVGWSGYVGAFVTHVTGWQLPAAWVSAPLAWDVGAGRMVATGAYVNLPAAVVVLAVCALLARGTRESARINAIIVTTKLTVVLLFVGFAARYVEPAHWRPFVPPNTGVFGEFGVSGVFQGATMLFFSYLGFDAVSVAAAETRNPRRDVPIGLFASLGICAALYIAVAAVLTGIVPYTSLGVPYPIAVGVAATGMGWLETVVEVGAIAGLTSVLLVQLYAQPRIVFAMAKDGFLPPRLAVLHPRHHTPHVLTWINGVLCAVCAGLLPITILAELTSIGTLFAFVLVGAGVMLLRYQRPEAPRKFKVPGGPILVPALCMVTSGVLMYTAAAATLWRLLVWMLLGGVLYLGYGRHQARQVRQTWPKVATGLD